MCYNDFHGFSPLHGAGDERRITKSLKKVL